MAVLYLVTMHKEQTTVDGKKTRMRHRVCELGDTDASVGENEFQINYMH